MQNDSLLCLLEFQECCLEQVGNPDWGATRVVRAERYCTDPFRGLYVHNYSLDLAMQERQKVVEGACY